MLRVVHPGNHTDPAKRFAPKAISELTLAEREELGDVDMGIWYGLFGPAKMLPTIANRLNRAFHDALKDPGVQAQLSLHATTVFTEGSPFDFEDYARRDIALYRGIVRETKMQTVKPQN